MTKGIGCFHKPRATPKLAGQCASLLTEIRNKTHMPASPPLFRILKDVAQSQERSSFHRAERNEMSYIRTEDRSYTGNQNKEERRGGEVPLELRNKTSKTAGGKKNQLCEQTEKGDTKKQFQPWPRKKE